MTFVLVVAVREHLDLHLRDLATVSLHLGGNFRLVEYVFTVNFTADGVNLSDFRHDVLKTGVDLLELLHALLLVHLLFDHHVVLFLLASLLVIQSSLLVLHTLLESFAFFLHICTTSRDSLLHQFLLGRTFLFHLSFHDS